MARGNLILDRYEPIGMAGSGGFGTVQIAWDPRIQRKVAIKTITLTEQDAFRAALPGAQAVATQGSTADRWHGVTPWNEYLAQADSDSGDPGASHGSVEADYEVDQVHALAHLPGLDEARTAAMLSDPRIVTVFDFEVRGRVAYLIMEYIEGIQLTDLLHDYANALTLDIVAAVFDAVAGALSAAHKAGVLHLDIKPDNILINAQGEVKVTDFGLATLADASGMGTTGGGTIGYMPLEQMRREHLDARTDEWALASVTYEMLTGENPFHAENLDLAEKAIEEAELILPSLCWNDLDEQIDDVVFFALDPDREERYASVADFAEEAEKFLGDPVAGKEQLSDVVSDALGFFDEELDDEFVDEDNSDYRESRHARFGLWSAITGWLRRPPATDENETGGNAAYTAYEAYDDDEQGDYRSHVKPKAPRVPVRDRVSSKVLQALARVFAAVASGAITWVAVSNMPMFSLFGQGSVYVMGAIAIAVAALGALRPGVGALGSFGLFAVALMSQGAVVVGIALLAAVIVWWVIAGREGFAASNAALALPVLGAIGGSAAVPLLAGTSLRPVQAVVTTAFAAVCALVLGGTGSLSLFGWDALPYTSIAFANVADGVVWMVQRPSTWYVIGSWIVASVVQSLLWMDGKKWLRAIGVLASTAIIVVTAIVFAGIPISSLGIAIAVCVVLLFVVLF